MIDQYQFSPVQRAICEFRFSSEENWDITFPGIFYQQISDKFPKKRVIRNVSSAGGGQSPPEIHLTERVQFARDDESAIVQISPNILSTIQLDPYPGWQEFKYLITSITEQYRSVNTQEELERIGLRYINHIEIPQSQGSDILNLDDYFWFYPEVGGDLPYHGVFRMSVFFSFEDNLDQMQIQLTLNPSENLNAYVFNLDLDYFRHNPENITVNNPEDWLETAHQHIKDMFENCITDNTRELFKGS